MEKEKQPKQTMIGQVDEAQIQAWKKEYQTPTINFVVTEDDDGNKHITYLKQPSFDHLDILTAKSRKSKELEGLRTIFNSLRIGGSDEVSKNYHMHFSAIQAVGELLKSVKGSLGKL